LPGDLQSGHLGRSIRRHPQFIRETEMSPPLSIETDLSPPPRPKRARSTQELYDAYYFATGCGLPYNHQEKHWATFFNGIAARIVEDFPNACVLDAGCAMGFLVEALRQGGAEAYGIDISEYAINNVAPAAQPYCRVRSVTDPLPRPYDLIVCIEVLEHLQAHEAETAVANFCRYTDEVLFSSSPYDYKEATHFNVQPPDYWAELFARHGFFRDLDYDASYITGWAVRFRRCCDNAQRLVRSYERRMWHLDQAIQASRELGLEQRGFLAQNEQTIKGLRQQLAAREEQYQGLAREHAKALRVVLEDFPEREKRLHAEHDRRVQELSQRIQELQAEISHKSELVESLDRQRLEAFQQMEREEAMRDEQKATGQEQTADLAARIRELEAHNEGRECAFRVLTEELRRYQQLLQEKELLAQSLTSHLGAIHQSRSFWVARQLRWLRMFFFPPEALRTRLARLSLRTWHIWLQEGTWRTLCRAVRKIRRKLRPEAPAFVPPAPAAAAPPVETLIPEPPDTLDAQYALWIKQNEPTAWELEQQRRAVLPYRPLFSIVVPAYNTPIPFLVAMVESVRAQTYSHWELCIANGGSPDPLVHRALDAYVAKDARIRVKHLETNEGIAGNSNEALALATGDFIALLDHDDTLTPFALFEMARAINEDPASDFLYSDEDKIDASGDKRTQPHFKPDWSPDTLRSHNYICHLSCFRRDLLERTGNFRSGFDGSQDYDLILRATEQAQHIVHVPKVLYHWRMHQASCATAPDAKMYAYESAKKALREHLERIRLQGEVKDGKTLGVYEVAFALKEQPLVSIIISNKDNRDMLERCVRSVKSGTYSNYELIIIENNSQEAETFDLYARLEEDPKNRVVRWGGPFNYSAVNNYGAGQAKGDILLFLNNDIEAINPDWIEQMLQHVQRSEVGAVGAKLYYPNNTVQHGGVILALGGIAGHAHQKFPGWHFGYFGRLIVTQDLSAVTAACLMTKRHIFNEIGGFDERYVLAFNDVDFCVKIRQKGYLIVWTPFAELYHHESLTRGLDDTPEKLARFIKEAELFATEWSHVLEEGDPYYNSAFTLQKADFSYKLAPEGEWKLSNFLLTTSRGKASIGHLNAA
jgi:GT2 family glycosyltransferase